MGRLALMLVAIGCLGPTGPGVGTGSGPSLPQDTECGEDTWCWVRGEPLQIVGDRAADTVAVVGARGAFFVWSGDAWVSSRVPTERAIVDAWVPSRLEAWVADEEGAVWHLRDGQWEDASPPGPSRRLQGVDGVAYASVATGDDGPTLMTFEDGDWRAVVESHPYCLAGPSYWVDPTRQVWSSGLVCDEQGRVQGSLVHRHDGTAWVQMGERFEDVLFPEFMDVPGTVQVSAGGWYAWDGSTWQLVERPDRPSDVPLGFDTYLDGLAYQIVPRTLGCRSAYALDGGTVFCLAPGQVYRLDVDTWVPTLNDRYAETQPADAWGTLPPTLWAGADTLVAWGEGPEQGVFRARGATGGSLERFDGATWQSLDLDGVVDIDGTAADDVWIATWTGLWHFDGQRVAPRWGNDAVADVHVLADGTVLAASGAEIRHFDAEGSEQTVYEAPEFWSVSSIGGTVLDDLWVVRNDRAARTDHTALDRFRRDAWVEQSLDSAYRKLFTDADGISWMSMGNQVVRLDTNDVTPLAPTLLYGQLWVGPEQVWLTDAHEALAVERP